MVWRKSWLVKPCHKHNGFMLKRKNIFFCTSAIKAGSKIRNTERPISFWLFAHSVSKLFIHSLLLPANHLWHELTHIWRNNDELRGLLHKSCMYILLSHPHHHNGESEQGNCQVLVDPSASAPHERDEQMWNSLKSGRTCKNNPTYCSHFVQW